MDCKQAKILLGPHILGDLYDEPQRCKELQAHLLCCRDCAEMYEGLKETIGFILEHKAEFAQAFENARARERTHSVQISSRTSFPKIRKIFIKVSAVAACLVIGVFLCLVFSHYSKPHPHSENVVFQRVASVVNPSVKVELLTNAGNIPIPSAQKITSTNQIKTLLINGKHHLTMNTNTALFVESLVEHNNIGCLVKLDSGRIYTHVEHDGNPFIVDTAHGKAVITGTTFDIKATENSTTLVVSEGIVKFESDKGVVNVAAGQTSEIVGQSAPSIPLSCNTVELTAWATGYKPNNTLDQIKSTADSYDVAELSLFGAKSPIDLESINYDNWLEENRDWFKREFPWIFRLKNALAKEGIEVDYPELLITSGDIWQFVYPEVSATRFPVLDPESLLKIATHYGYDSQWLFKVVPDATIVHQMSENVCFGLKAFEKWISCFDKPLKLSKEVDSSVLFYSLHASVYLAKTKTLVWLCVEKSSYAGEKKDETELLTLHQKQVCTAHDNLQLTIQLMTTQREPCTTEYGDLLNRMIQNIAFLSACEEQIKNLQE